MNSISKIDKGARLISSILYKNFIHYKRGDGMSVFYSELDVKIANNESKLSKELVIYEGDKGLEVYFNLKDYTFCLKPVNILQRMDNLVGAYAQITLITQEVKR